MISKHVTTECNYFAVFQVRVHLKLASFTKFFFFYFCYFSFAITKYRWCLIKTQLYTDRFKFIIIISFYFFFFFNCHYVFFYVYSKHFRSRALRKTTIRSCSRKADVPRIRPDTYTVVTINMVLSTCYFSSASRDGSVFDGFSANEISA